MPGTGDAPADTCAADEQQGSVFLEDDSNPAREPRLRERSAQAGSAASQLGLSGSRRDLREMHRRASRVRDDAEDAQNGLPRIFSTFNSLAM